MKLREHRGSLAESMDTAVEIEPTLQAIYEVIAKRLKIYELPISPSVISVAPYGYDERIGWDTHVVILKGYGVFGFTDGPVIDGVSK